MLVRDAEQLAAPRNINHIDVRSAQMDPSYCQTLCLERQETNEVTVAELRLHAVTHELAKHTHSYTRVSETNLTLSTKFIPCITDSADRIVHALTVVVANVTAAIAAAADSDRHFAAKVAEFVRRAAAAHATAAEDRRLAAVAAVLAAKDRKIAADFKDRMIIYLNEMEHDLLEMSAMSENLVIRSRNRYAFKDFSSHGRNEPLAPLCKERAGAGVALPGVRAKRIPIPLAVGDTVGAPFPANIRDFKALTQRQLSYLAMMLNQDFGITAGDSLRARRAKFQRFIS